MSSIFQELRDRGFLYQMTDEKAIEQGLSFDSSRQCDQYTWRRYI